MKWKCPVCGLVMDSDTKPLACPFCGVNGSYIILNSEYKETAKSINEKTIESLKAALDLESNATDIYLKNALECEKLGDNEAAILFEALAKVEDGHKAAIRRMLSK